MAAHPAWAAPPPPPPSNSDPSAPAFKSNASGPSPGQEPAHGASASPRRRRRRRRSVASDALVAVLLARGLLARLKIPEAELTDARASALFDAVLAAFFAEVAGPVAASYVPIPPQPLGNGRKVELVRLFLAVRARSGFAAVASWAAVAEAVGLDPAADTAVKLLYRKYLALLDRSFAKQLEDHEVVESSGNAGQCLAPPTTGFLSSPTKGPTNAGSAHLKRKRDELVGMLNCLVAKSPAEPGIEIDPQGHISMAVRLRDQMFANDDDCLRSEDLEGMLNWVRLMAKSPAEPGVIGRNCLSHISTVLPFRDQKFANVNCRNGSASP